MAKRGRKAIKYITNEQKKAYAEKFYDRHSKLVLKSIKADNPRLTDENAKAIFVSELSYLPKSFSSTAQAEHYARQILATYRGEDTDLSQALYDVRKQAKQLGVDLRGANLLSKKVEIPVKTLWGGTHYYGKDSQLINTMFDVDSYYTIPTNPNYVIASGYLYYQTGHDQRVSPIPHTEIIPIQAVRGPKNA